MLLMNRAVLKKEIRDAFWLLAGCASVMFGFLWLFVYLTSFIATTAFIDLLGSLPDDMHGLAGISIQEAASWPGRLALAFVDPTVVLISAIWSIARGSAAVSGPLDRGTLEMVLAQPVSRLSVLLAHSSVTLFGCALLAVCAWLGLWAGIATVSVEQTRWFGLVKEMVPLSEITRPHFYVHSALNLFCLTVFTAALATFISACGRYRWRTIGIVGGFYVIQIIVKVAGLSAEPLQWLFRFTFLGAYWPQVLAVQAMKPAPNDAWALSLQYNGILLGLAYVCFVAAGVVFHRRDLPAPL
jgi:ABC-2 type transport system permease protein